jgi:intracellular septation protein
MFLSQAEIKAPAKVWKHAEMAFILVFILLGIANLIVANYFFESEHMLAQLINGVPNIENCTATYHGDALELCQRTKHYEENWVNFKLFGLTGLSLIFTLGIAFYVIKNASNYEELVKSKS